MRGTHVISPNGSVDLAVVRALRTQWFTPGGRDVPRTVVVDLAEVLVLDPRALTALIQLRRELRACDGDLLLRSASPHLQTMLDVTGLHRVFPDAALKAPAGTRPSESGGPEDPGFLPPRQGGALRPIDHNM